MKICLSICAKELPTEGNYYATATLGEELLGKTDVVQKTTSPSWKSVVLFEKETAADKTLTIKVFQTGDDAVVSTIAVPGAQLLEQSTVALDGDGASGTAVVAVHAEDYHLVPGTLQLQLEANQLENKERGLGFLRKSDPFYELALSNSDATILFQSEVVRNDLSPKWPLANIDLEPLFAAGMDLSTPLKLTFYDQDKGTKRDLIGGTEISIQQLMSTHHFKDKEGLKDALVVIKRASLVGHGGSAVSATAAQALQNAANTLVAKQSLEKAKAVAAQCLERAKALAKVADDKTKAAAQAAQDTKHAKDLVTALETKAKETAEKAKTAPCTGSLLLILAGKDLANTDGLGIFNKSDPVYELYGTSGKSVYRSEIVQDNLNPVFKPATIDVNKLTNGDFEGPLRITIYDKDGGMDKNYLGQVVTTLTALLTAKPTDLFMKLTASSGHAKGHLMVPKAELVDYHNLAELAEKLTKDAEAAYSSIPAQVKAEKMAAEEATAASSAAAQAQAAADAAQKVVEAASA